MPDKIVMWGTGAQARLIMDKADVVRRTGIAYFVDPRQTAQGKKVNGLPVLAPSALLNDSRRVMIGAVQSAPFIYRDLKKLGIDMKRFIGGIVL